jgi:hypothetical protein
VAGSHWPQAAPWRITCAWVVARPRNNMPLAPTSRRRARPLARARARECPRRGTWWAPTGCPGTRGAWEPPPPRLDTWRRGRGRPQGRLHGPTGSADFSHFLHVSAMVRPIQLRFRPLEPGFHPVFFSTALGTFPCMLQCYGKASCTSGKRGVLHSPKSPPINRSPFLTSKGRREKQRSSKSLPKLVLELG